MWSRYLMTFQDYQHFFKEDTELTKKDTVSVELQVRGIENKNDKETEYSVEWENLETNEGGFIYKINTSSVFAFNSCSWYDCDENEHSDSVDEVPLSDNYKTKEIIGKIKKSIDNGMRQSIVVAFD